jgi:hypothetical protein
MASLPARVRSLAVVLISAARGEIPNPRPLPPVL